MRSGSAGEWLERGEPTPLGHASAAARFLKAPPEAHFISQLAMAPRILVQGHMIPVIQTFDRMW